MKTLLLSVLLVSLLWIGGCGTTRSVGEQVDRVQLDPETFLETHHRNWSNLPRLDTRASGSTWWEDQQGRHVDRFQIRLFYEAPHDLAVNCSVLGSRVAWIGASSAESWIFMFDKDETVLMISDDQDTSDDRSVPIWSAQVLKQVLMLSPLPPLSSGSIDWDSKGRLMLTLPVAGNRPWSSIRLCVDESGHVRRQELLAADSTELASAEYDDHVSVPVDSMAPGDYPRLPRRIRITTSRDSGMNIFLDEPTGRGGPRKRRIFDLEQLKQQFKPDRIERVNGPAGTSELGGE